MRPLGIIMTAAVAASTVAGGGWFPGAKPVYNKWHENELERWLSDQDIPHPTAADRKDLEALVEKNWNDAVVEPYNNWDTSQLNAFLQQKGIKTKANAEEARDTIVSQVKSNWYESEESAQQAWSNIKDWVLDTWSDSQLKKLCDQHGIPVPQPRSRDIILQKARFAYEAAAKKVGETSAYPGNWLYDTWSTSDLKAWLDSNGLPSPQPSTRDKLIAYVRRSSRLVYLKAQDTAASASASARAAYATVTDKAIDSWGEAQLKEFCDKNGIPVPQGSKTNELRALVRKRRADVFGDNVAGSISSAFGAATSRAGNEFARASDSASLAARDAFNGAIGLWSESRLKSYLDARGVPVPQGSNVDNLRALVRKHAHKAAHGGDTWDFDDLSAERLKHYLAQSGDKVAEAAARKKDASREELVSAAQSAYAAASTAGGSRYATATKNLASATAAAKKDAFETWSDSELKAYLDSYGVPVPQGSTLEQLKSQARKQATYFKHGTTSPGGTLLVQLQDAVQNGWHWLTKQVSQGSQAAQDKVSEAEAKAQAKIREEL